MVQVMNFGVTRNRTHTLSPLIAKQLCGFGDNQTMLICESHDLMYVLDVQRKVDCVSSISSCMVGSVCPSMLLF